MPEKKRTGEVDWEDIRYFLDLSHHGTLSTTARKLKVKHSTVARSVASLEARLGRVLFERRADGYSLTAQGRRVLDDASAMDEAALSLVRRLDGGTELSGLVRLTLVRPLADSFLVDRLAAFRKRYPAIDIELIADPRLVSLARREADMAVRFGAPKDSDLIARRLGSITFGLYASPAFRDELKAGHPPSYIGFEESGDFIAEAQWLARHCGDGGFSFRTNSQTSQAAAARAGYGVALLPRYLAARDRALVPVLRGKQLLEREVWLVLSRDLRNVPRVRALADYLVELFRRERRLFAG